MTNFPRVVSAVRRRLRPLGLWRDIHLGGAVTKGVGGAYFVSQDSRALVEALLASGQFAIDTRAGGMLHRNQLSLREVTNGSGLHLLVQAGNRIEAHIDAVSPVIGTKPGGWGRYRWSRVLAHFGRDVLPLAMGRHPRSDARSTPRPTQPQPPSFGRPQGAGNLIFRGHSLGQGAQVFAPVTPLASFGLSGSRQLLPVALIHAAATSRQEVSGDCAALRRGEARLQGQSPFSSSRGKHVLHTPELCKRNAYRDEDVSASPRRAARAASSVRLETPSFEKT